MKCFSCGAENLGGADECQSCQSSLTSGPAAAGLERRILEGKVADLKPKKARTIAPGRKALEAAEAMRQARIGCLLVVEGGALQGILSERELVQRSSSGDLSGVSVKELMRGPDAAILDEDDSAADAFHGMAVAGQRHLPIRLKDGGYGVVSARDLLRYLCA